MKKMVNVILSHIPSNKEIKSETHRILSHALATINHNFDNINTIIIKPNLCYYWDYSTGETTDPRLVAAIIDFLRAHFGNVQIIIAEADASAMRVKYAFKMLGYEQIAQKKNIKLVNLSKGIIREKDVRVNGRKMVLKINEVLCDPHVLINVPKLKYHRFVGVTCGLKNIFGCISTPRKIIYHKQISDVIVGINKIVRSDMTIVDGLIVKGKYPQKMGVLIVSNDVLKADYIVAQMLGYNPAQIHHIDLAKKENIVKIHNIELLEDGITLKEVKRKFPKENRFIQNLSWDLQIKLLKAYSKILGDIVPPVLT